MASTKTYVWEGDEVFLSLKLSGAHNFKLISPNNILGRVMNIFLNEVLHAEGVWQSFVAIWHIKPAIT